MESCQPNEVWMLFLQRVEGDCKPHLAPLILWEKKIGQAPSPSQNIPIHIRLKTEIPLTSQEQTTKISYLQLAVRRCPTAAIGSQTSNKSQSQQDGITFCQRSTSGQYRFSFLEKKKGRMCFKTIFLQQLIPPYITHAFPVNQVSSGSRCKVNKHGYQGRWT